ncbi:MAG: hypothetical protein AABZ30_02435 [Myxococcota bacterium]
MLAPVVPLRPWRSREATALVGTACLIVACAVYLVTMLAVAPPREASTAYAALLLSASLVFEVGRRRLRQRDMRGFGLSVVAAIVLGASAIVSRVGAGLDTVAALHVLYAIGGLGALGWLLACAWCGSVRPARDWRVRAVALYWWFVGGAGLVVLAVT